MAFQRTVRVSRVWAHLCAGLDERANSFGVPATRRHVHRSVAPRVARIHAALPPRPSLSRLLHHWCAHFLKLPTP
jgi:hypothetical protein